MWYRFSKLKWNYDIAVGIDYTYAYVKESNEENAIKRLTNLMPKGNMIKED